MGLEVSQDRDGSVGCAIAPEVRPPEVPAGAGAGCVAPPAHANASLIGANPLGASSIGSGAGLQPSGPSLETDTVGSFEQQMLPHLGAAFTLARYLLREAADAEDAVQDAYLQALRHFRGFRGDNARAWLLTIVRRVCYAWADRGRRHGWPTDPDLLDDLPAVGDDPEAQLIRGRGGTPVSISRGDRPAGDSGTFLSGDRGHHRGTRRHGDVAPVPRPAPVAARARSPGHGRVT
jgi:hypothetical protein